MKLFPVQIFVRGIRWEILAEKNSRRYHWNQHETKFAYKIYLQIIFHKIYVLSREKISTTLNIHIPRKSNDDYITQGNEYSVRFEKKKKKKKEKIETPKA